MPRLMMILPTRSNQWICWRACGRCTAALRDFCHLALSPKEFALFRNFMKNAGDVVTREMQLRDVWHMDFDPQSDVVD